MKRDNDAVQHGLAVHQELAENLAKAEAHAHQTLISKFA